MEEIIKFEQAVLNDEKAELVINESNELFLVNLMINYGRIRYQFQQYYFDTFSKFLQIDRVKKLFLRLAPNNMPILLYYFRNYFDIKEIIERIQTSKSYLAALYFRDEFGDFNEDTKGYIGRNNFFSYLQNSNLDEYLIYGYPKDSLGYCIKYDDAERINGFFSLPFYNYEEIELSKFEFYGDNSSLSLEVKGPLSMAAIYGSLRCFRFLLLHNCAKNISLTKCAISGGNIDIIREIHVNVEEMVNCMKYSSYFGRIDFLDYLLNMQIDQKLIDRLLFVFFRFNF